LGLHDVPEGWILNLELVQLESRLLDSALDLARVLLLDALLDFLLFFSELGNRFQDDVHQLDVIAGRQESAQRLLVILLFVESRVATATKYLF